MRHCKYSNGVIGITGAVAGGGQRAGNADEDRILLRFEYAGRELDEPYDSLDFASTILSLAGHTAHLLRRAVPMQWRVRTADEFR